MSPGSYLSIGYMLRTEKLVARWPSQRRAILTAERLGEQSRTVTDHSIERLGLHADTSERPNPAITEAPEPSVSTNFDQPIFDHEDGPRTRSDQQKWNGSSGFGNASQGSANSSKSAVDYDTGEAFFDTQEDAVDEHLGEPIGSSRSSPAKLDFESSRHGHSQLSNDTSYTPSDLGDPITTGNALVADEMSVYGDSNWIGRGYAVSK